MSLWRYKHCCADAHNWNTSGNLVFPWNSLLATWDPFVSIFSTVALLCAFRVQLLIAKLLRSSRLWSRERRAQLHSIDKRSLFWHGVRYCGAWSVLIHVTEECRSYLAPKCIYTGSPLSCTLHCSSDPLDRKRYTIRTLRRWFSWICAFYPIRPHTWFTWQR